MKNKIQEICTRYGFEMKNYNETEYAGVKLWSCSLIRHDKQGFDCSVEISDEKFDVGDKILENRILRALNYKKYADKKNNDNDE
jgi:hypothetical protein